MTYSKAMQDAVAQFGAEARAIQVCPPASATGIGKFTPAKVYLSFPTDVRWSKFYSDEISRLANRCN